MTGSCRLVISRVYLDDYAGPKVDLTDEHVQGLLTAKGAYAVTSEGRIRIAGAGR
ncbi:MAG: hypothetical protein ACR2RB_21135 [Gammaproteobacteria bacterium]